MSLRLLSHNDRSVGGGGDSTATETVRSYTPPGTRVTNRPDFFLGCPDLIFPMWDFKFSRRRVWCSELSSGLYCRVKRLSTDVSEVRTASIIRDEWYWYFLYGIKWTLNPDGEKSGNFTTCGIFNVYQYNFIQNTFKYKATVDGSLL
jgi:hypothetical protein